ncbi:hypothetical protein BCL76_113130 [Streptomyces sp. CG 926]|uniref:hypothetical protein n=1 Tax=Streptomyces sp. CG 926 TaxID=1882405 RepID=UPI000D6B3604|nr:hypothetical protein [Streptomyces sp. CG 926]PWK65143.1 hypothetical protein BCL76_113130 [Streptomyces sp. CG 926]
MTTSPQRTVRSPRKTAVVAAAVATVALLGGLHLWLNTNTFGDSALCGGVVSAHDAEAVLTGAGRITSRPGALSGADDGRTRFDCVIERSAAAQPGSGRQRLFVRGTSERGDFAFTGGNWPDASTASFFPGGGVAPGRAWVQLPAGCTADEAGLVWGNTEETANSEKLVGLLTSTANRISTRAGCTPPAPLSAPDRIAPPAAQRPATAGSVCALPGFTLPAVARETVQDSGATWSCGTATAEGPKQAYATFSATRDPAVISAIRKSKGFNGQGFDATHTLSDCSGKPTYFAMETGSRYTESLGAGAPDPQDLFTAFTKAAAAKFSCANA